MPRSKGQSEKQGLRVDLEYIARNSNYAVWCRKSRQIWVQVWALSFVSFVTSDKFFSFPEL